MKIKNGDNVVIITGKDRNKTGKVIRVLEKSGRIVVENLNMVTRHKKKTSQKKGEKIKFEASLNASNVMLIDPKTKKATRIGYRVTKEGKKERIAKNSNTVL
jgi:large subunit ribosomal protein L24